MTFKKCPECGTMTSEDTCERTLEDRQIFLCGWCGCKFDTAGNVVGDKDDD